MYTLQHLKPSNQALHHPQASQERRIKGSVGRGTHQILGGQLPDNPQITDHNQRDQEQVTGIRLQPPQRQREIKHKQHTRKGTDLYAGKAKRQKLQKNRSRNQKTAHSRLLTLVGGIGCISNRPGLVFNNQYTKLNSAIRNYINTNDMTSPPLPSLQTEDHNGNHV